MGRQGAEGPEKTQGGWRQKGTLEERETRFGKGRRPAVEGDPKAAEKIWAALEGLYRDDPFAQEILAEVKRGRGGQGEMRSL